MSVIQLNIKCDRCGGPVWTDIVSENYIDLACIYCAKRWFAPKKKYLAWLKRKEKEHADKTSGLKYILAKPTKGIQSTVG